MSLNSMRVIKLQSVRYPECFGNCLLWARERRLQLCDAIVVGGSCVYRMWPSSVFILLKSLSSAVSHSSANDAVYDEQKPLRLARRIKPSMRCRSDADVNPH